jgi:uncharacterized protein (TIGR02147 family)
LRRTDTTKITTLIYEYFDFRAYLRDLAAEFKERRPDFNLRDFAKKAGLKSPGLLKMVIDGKRRLTAETLEAFATAFELKGREKIYFETLVRYNQAKDPDRKREYFETLIDLRPSSQKFILERHHHHFLTRDYYVTIREMVLLDNFKEDYNWIADRCAPSISAKEAKEAVETLFQLGLLARDEQGKIIQVQNFIQTTDHHTQAIEAYHFHEAVLNKARKSLAYLEQEKRRYESLTLTLPNSMLDEVMTEYYRLRDWIVNRANEIGVSDEVYHVNFQVFPATWQKDEDKS